VTEDAIKARLTPRLSPLTDEVRDLLKEFALLRPLLRGLFLSAAVEDTLVSDEELRSVQSQYCMTNQISSEEELDKHLITRGIDRSVWSSQLALPLKVNRYANEMFSAKAEARFLAKKQSLDTVSYSLIRVSDENIAYNLFLQLEEDPLSFARIASLYGEGPEKSQGGRIGPVSLSQGDPELTSCLRRSIPGIVNEPFKLQNWWLLVRLDQLHPARFDDEMHHTMCHELFNEWPQGQIDLMLAT